MNHTTENGVGHLRIDQYCNWLLKKLIKKKGGGQAGVRSGGDEASAQRLGGLALSKVRKVSRLKDFILYVHTHGAGSEC